MTVRNIPDQDVHFGCLNNSDIAVTATEQVICTVSVTDDIAAGLGSYAVSCKATNTKNQNRDLTFIVYDDGAEVGRAADIRLDRSDDHHLIAFRGDISAEIAAGSNLELRVLADNTGITINGSEYVSGFDVIKATEFITRAEVSAAWRANLLRDTAVFCVFNRSSNWNANNFSVATGVPWESVAAETIPGATLNDIGGSNPEQITIGITGAYVISGIASLDSTGGNSWTCTAQLYVNGNPLQYTLVRTGSRSNTDNHISFSLPVQLQVGDEVEWKLDHNHLTGRLRNASLALTLAL
jgi:hypothetical protein